MCALCIGCTIAELRKGGFPLLAGALGGFTLAELRASPDPAALLAAIQQRLLEVRAAASLLSV